MNSKCHNIGMFVISFVGQWTAYCPECRATHISNDEGKIWNLLKEIQPNHPSPFFTKEMEIVHLLHSITKLSVESGELDIWFDYTKNVCGIREFKYESFTRKLLELIEDELLND